MRMDPAIETPPQTPDEKAPVIIETVGLKKTYLKGKPGEVRALRGITLSISQGEFVSIMGPSGSGKSTLLNILGCMDKASEGVARIDNIEITNIPQHKLSAVRKGKIGFVFQDMFLIPTLSALDNVLAPLIPFGVSRNDRKRAEDLLKKVGLENRMKHKPNEMSGGEKQRVAICRSLINNPMMIFADEPTGNMDTVTGKEIMEILTRINKESSTTIVIVTHDPVVASYSTRTVTLTDGNIINDMRLTNASEVAASS